jgi:hypothetical protein
MAGADAEKPLQPCPESQEEFRRTVAAAVVVGTAGVLVCLATEGLDRGATVGLVAAVGTSRRVEAVASRTELDPVVGVKRTMVASPDDMNDTQNR